MSGYGRRRTAIATVKPTPEVVTPWRDLIAAARAAAWGAPSAAVPGLAKQATSSKRLPVPGALTTENPCIRLGRTARLYAGETTAGRRGMQADLLTAADAASEHLDAEIKAAAGAK